MSQSDDSIDDVLPGNPYDALGVPRVVNCMGAVTFLGGLPIRPAAEEAMRNAFSSKVNLFDLNAAVGRRIAAICRSDAAFVTSGATGAMQLAAAAAITGGVVDRVARLPDVEASPRPEIVLHRKHRITFDHALRNTGAKLVEFGYAWDRTERWELEAAITERTVAVFYVSHFGPSSVLRLEEVIATAHEYGVPVIVDAAVSLPPRANLWQLPGTGADLTCFSGGKAIGGPQNTGFVVGRGDLVEACAANANPNHNTIGRPAKVNAEALVGLVAALEAYLAEDEQQEYSGWMSMLRHIESLMAPRGIVSAIAPTSKNDMPIPTLRIVRRTVEDARRATEWLQDAERPIWVIQDGCELVVDPHALVPDDVEYVGTTLAEVLANDRLVPKEDS